MNTIDDIDDDSIELTVDGGPDNAFQRAMNPLEFLGGPLAPWSPDRKIAAQSMGMRYPVIGDDGLEQMQSTGVYPGALKDTIIFLWLRAANVKEVHGKEGVEKSPLSRSDIMRAERKPIEAWDQALKWAEENHLIDMSGEAFEKGYTIFIEKMGAEVDARSVPEQPADSGDGTDPNV